jgi:hypothetical protein
MARYLGALTVALSACGGLVDHSATSNGHADGGGSGTSGASNQDAAGVPDAVPDVDSASPDADGAKPCVPEPGMWNCCNGEVCRGTCEFDGCECGSMQNGCPAPLVCCGTVCKAQGKC